MEKVKYSGKMETFLKEILKLVKRLEKEYLNGMIHLIMMENFRTKIFMVMVNINGMEEDFTKDNGLMVRWKDKDC